MNTDFVKLSALVDSGKPLPVNGRRNIKLRKEL